MEDAEKYKEMGTEEYKSKDYKSAIDWYTRAISML